MDMKKQMHMMHNLFEIGAYVGDRLARVFVASPEAHERLLNHVGGASKLFEQYAYKWATEFTEQHPTPDDYLAEIDRFTNGKINDLFLEARDVPKVVTSGAPRVVTGVEVLPMYHEHGSLSTVVQFEGPTEKTEYWSVYEVESDSCSRWVADFQHPDLADRFAAMHATALGVQVRPKQWIAQADAKAAPEPPTFTFLVTWEIDIEAASPREAAQRAREIQQDRTNFATTYYVSRRDREQRPRVTVHLENGEAEQ